LGRPARSLRAKLIVVGFRSLEQSL
jgi:hypothetical protein